MYKIVTVQCGLTDLLLFLLQTPLRVLKTLLAPTATVVVAVVSYKVNKQIQIESANCAVFQLIE